MRIIDKETLIATVDGDYQMLNELFILFRDESQSLQSQLELAIKDQNWNSIRSLTHTMKGMLMNFQVESVCETTQLIHDLDAKSFSSAPSLMNRLREQLNAMLLDIKSIMDSV